MSSLGKLKMWGLSPLQMHDQFWSARGIQVVRPMGDLTRVLRGEAYMLLEATKLVLFNPAPALTRLHWIDPLLLTIRVRPRLRWSCSHESIQENGGPCSYLTPYRELSDRPCSRAVMTTEVEIALMWNGSGHLRSTWRSIRRKTTQDRRAACCLQGVVANSEKEDETSQWMGHLTSAWRRPDRIIDNCQRVAERVYKDARTPLAKRIGSDVPLWMGFGREAVSPGSRGGPVILWDAAVSSESNGNSSLVRSVETIQVFEGQR